MVQEELDLTRTLELMRGEGDGFTAVLAPNWAQGRAGFGGMVAALGLEAIRRRAGTDWPLRSLTVAFVGPAVGDLAIEVQPLRAGRSAAFLQAVLRAGDPVVATVSACFGPDRASELTLHAPAGPDVPPPEACPEIPLVDGVTPTFLRNLEIRIAEGRIFDGSGGAELLWWVRHRDVRARGTEAGFVALLDTLPPAGAGLLTRPAPLSSLTWMVDFPTADFTTDDGWYLLRSTADYVGGGFSGQSMTAWTRSGRLAALHRQSVAIFA